MNLKLIAPSLAALSLGVAPVAAAANPASSLSVAQSARAGSSTERDSGLAAPGSGIGLALAALVVAGGIYLVVDDDDDDDEDEPDSP